MRFFEARFRYRTCHNPVTCKPVCEMYVDDESLSASIFRSLKKGKVVSRVPSLLS